MDSLKKNPSSFEGNVHQKGTKKCKKTKQNLKNKTGQGTQNSQGRHDLIMSSMSRSTHD